MTTKSCKSLKNTENNTQNPEIIYSDFEYFTEKLLQWYLVYGRKSLPWQSPLDAYRIWVSEVMLQQTQVKTVIPYFNRFFEKFPNVATLALAPIDEVLNLWAGLGYYSRAKNLHRAAQYIYQKFNGQCPSTYKDWLILPGIGESTAAAICSLAFNQPHPILDGNVKRVLSRYFLIQEPINQAETIKKLWHLAELCMSKIYCRDYTQAIMDLGALCCTRSKPQCSSCPISTHCQALLHNQVQQIPYKTKQQTRPTIQQHFIILKANNALYFEKRGPNGIWSGLWCLPAINNNIKIKPNLIIQELIKQITYDNANNQLTINQIAAFKHAFTHFHLNITASYIDIPQDRINLLELPGTWFSLDQIHTLALPAPIKKIINKLSI